METMKRTYQVTGVVFLLFSAFIVWQSLDLKFYTSLGPGPGFFPFWLAVLFGVLSISMLYSATFKPQDPMPADFWASKKGYLRNGAIILAFVFVIKTMEEIGFVIASFIFYMFLLLTLGKRSNPIAIILVAIGGSWGVYQVFTQYLKVVLPAFGQFGI